MDNVSPLERSETIALQGLGFLMSTPVQAARFLNETGFAPSDIQARAGERDVLEAVLSVLLNDEASLLAFAANHGLDPAAVVEAHDMLARAGSDKRPLGSI